MLVVLRLIISIVAGWLTAGMIVLIGTVARKRGLIDGPAMNVLAFGALIVGFCLLIFVFRKTSGIGIQTVSREEAENGFDVHLSLPFLAFTFAIGIVTLGVTAIPFWVMSRRFPRRVDREGLTLRNGTLIRWQDVSSVTKGVKTMGGTPIGVWYDLETVSGKVPIIVNNLANGRAVLNFCSRQLGQTLSADA